MKTNGPIAVIAANEPKAPAEVARPPLGKASTLARFALICVVLAATVSELIMYGLMFVLPLVGWGMLSAARYPIVLYGSLHLPFILPHDAMLYAVLRKAHTVLAYLFFLTILAHFGAILFHTLIVRDGILKRMAPWNIRPREASTTNKS